MKKNLLVQDLLDRLGREEQHLKHAGAFGEAAGIRDAIVQVLKMADEGESSIEPSEDE